MKVVLFMILFLNFACGQKSTIKGAQEAKTLAEVYGNGTSVIHEITFPVSDSALAFDTPLPGLGPVAGGLLRFMGNLFTRTTDLGKMQLSYMQPLPNIPEDIVSSIKLRRVFVYMKPPQGNRRFRDWLTRLIMGKDNVTFEFMDKLVLKISSVQTNVQESTFSDSALGTREVSDLLSSIADETVQDKSSVKKEVFLLKYNQKRKDKFLKKAELGTIHILETTGDPVRLKRLFLKSRIGEILFNRVTILGKSVLVELKEDTVSRELFRLFMEQEADTIEELGVTSVDSCTPKYCLDFYLPDENLVPLINGGNALMIEAVL